MISFNPDFLFIRSLQLNLNNIKYLILLFFIYSNVSFAQNKTFKIRDKITNQPISFVAITTQKGNGTYSDEEGAFDFSISNKDTLYINHLSYQKIILSKNDIDNLVNTTIYLIPKVTELTEVIIKSKKPTKKLLGYYKEELYSARPGPGGGDFSIYINHLKNISQEVGYVNKLYFDLALGFFQKNSKARIRMYSVGVDGLPKDDILTKEIIETIDSFSPNIKVDVSDLKIVFPPEGVFIGLEFFCSFERKPLNKTGKKAGHYKIITNCPHVATAKVTDFEERGNSYYWSLYKNKFKWVCHSSGTDVRAWTGQVFKFGAEVSQ